MPFPQKPFYFVRHGETVANTEKRIAGWLETPLTDNGRSQAQRVSEIFTHLDIQPTKIYHSDLSRAHDTAHIINKKLNIAIAEHEGLREHNFGEFEGYAPWDDIIPQILQGITPKGGESQTMFRTRMTNVITQILNNHDGIPLLAAHGGFGHQFQIIFGQDGSHSMRNCHLHYFEPWPQNKPAPWKVHVFDEIEGKVIQSPAPWCPSITIRA